MRFMGLPILSRLILRRLLAERAGVGSAGQGVFVLFEGVEERLCLLRTHLAGLALRVGCGGLLLAGLRSLVRLLSLVWFRILVGFGLPGGWLGF